jgi:hypothetical protein
MVWWVEGELKRARVQKLEAAAVVPGVLMLMKSVQLLHVLLLARQCWVMVHCLPEQGVVAEVVASVRTQLAAAEPLLGVVGEEEVLVLKKEEAVAERGVLVLMREEVVEEPAHRVMEVAEMALMKWMKVS